MGRGSNSLPDRWLKYSALGQVISGSVIRCCKVPLRKEILRQLDPTEWFTPEMLMEQVPNAGLVVDLTATNRYYNGAVFTERGIRHVKIVCPGQTLPRDSHVQQFFRAIDEFTRDAASTGKVILVHCTHGVNRTGYMVTRYLVERTGMVPEKAIQVFNEARGHPIERENYIEGVLQIGSSSAPSTKSRSDDGTPAPPSGRRSKASSAATPSPSPLPPPPSSSSSSGPHRQQPHRSAPAGRDRTDRRQQDRNPQDRRHQDGAQLDRYRSQDRNRQPPPPHYHQHHHHRHQPHHHHHHHHQDYQRNRQPTDRQVYGLHQSGYSYDDRQPYRVPYGKQQRRDGEGQPPPPSPRRRHDVDGFGGV